MSNIKTMQIIRKNKVLSVFLTFFLVVFSLVSSLVVLELALRIGIVKNSRHKQLSYNKIPNSQNKILILGDSFGRIIDSFLINALTPHKIALFNTSREGSGPFEYLLEMKAQSAFFKPDITILFYYAGNDLTSVQYRSSDKSDLMGMLRALIREKFYNTYIYHFLIEKKYALAPRFFNYEKIRLSGVSPQAISLATSNKINPWILQECLENKNYIADNILMETADNLKAWQRTKILLGQVQDFAKRINSEFIIIIFPSTFQVSESRYTFYKGLGFDIDKKILSSNKPQRLLIEFCREKGIPCLDLLPFLKVEKEKNFYLEYDDHLNALGNEFCAKIVVDFLIKNTKISAGGKNRLGKM